MIDLRSDILTRPSKTMLSAMSKAAELPCGFGYREDAFVRRLEQRASEILDKEDALFLPTCTMANQIAIRMACQPGTTVLADAGSHVATTELPATSGLSSVVLKRLAGHLGHLSADQVKDALRREKADTSRRVKLIVLENTHNRAGGTVMPAGWQTEIHSIAKANDLAVHLDGARLWNASLHLGDTPAALARDVDTVAVSLNKALGAPVGALLAGRRDAIEEAARMRIMLGGGWRPVGLLAAAGLFAMEDEEARQNILRDHRNARRIAEELAGMAGLAVDLGRVQTNIVMIGTRSPVPDATTLLPALERNGVKALISGDEQIRLVLHSEIDVPQLGKIIGAFAASIRDVAGLLASAN